MSDTENNGLFLETSAQVLRLFGSSSVEREIESLLRLHGRVGTSAFVRSEFEAVIGGLFQTVATYLGKIPGQDRIRPFLDLWRETLGMLPPFTPGGPKPLAVLGASLGVKFGSRSVTPVEVWNFLLGQKTYFLEGFFLIGSKDLRSEENGIFDLSSCCSWRGHDQIPCTAAPSAACRLQLICSHRKPDFLASVETIANAKREESDWLKENLESLVALDGLLLMREIGHKPNIFGDIIIFWEVPEGWTILTRDLSFVVLRERHRPSLHVCRIRAPRTPTSGNCMIRSARAEVALTAQLSNYSSSGACVICSLPIGEIGDEVMLSSAEIGGSRSGKVVWKSATVAGSGHGVRFVAKRTHRPPKGQNESTRSKATQRPLFD
jgi:hypothetical protein